MVVCREGRDMPSERPETLTINGETRTISAWANAVGISHQLLRARARRGKVGAALLAPPGDAAARAKSPPGERFKWRRRLGPVTIGDQRHSLTTWARLSGVPYATLRSRYTRGARGPDLIRPARNGATYPVDGEELPLAEAAARLGLSVGALQWRIKCADPEHREKHRAKSRRIYAERKERGLCVRMGCDQSARAAHPYCDACRELVTARSRLAKRDARARGRAVGAVA
jgi:hypothetical protein